MSKIKNSGLDQYGAKPFKQQQYGTAGVVGVKKVALNGVRARQVVEANISGTAYKPFNTSMNWSTIVSTVNHCTGR